MSPARPAAALLRLGALAAIALTITAGAPSVRRSVKGAVPEDHPRVALVPFENLAGREEQGGLFTKVFFAQLVAADAFEMVDPGQVDEAMDSLGLRPGSSLTPAQIRALGDTLHARYLLLGSVLESGTVRTDGSDLPAVGATLRLVESDSSRVLWAAVHFRSGEDRETVFGWGRITSLEKLVAALASDMLSDFRAAGTRRLRQTPSGRTP